LLGNGDVIEIVYGEEKKFVLGRLEQTRNFIASKHFMKSITVNILKKFTLDFAHNYIYEATKLQPRKCSYQNKVKRTDLVQSFASSKPNEQKAARSLQGQIKTSTFCPEQDQTKTKIISLKLCRIKAKEIDSVQNFAGLNRGEQN
jgi:hypothetical protein